MFVTRFFKSYELILKYRVPLQRKYIPSSEICKKRIVIEMHAKKHNHGRCYALLWGKNCALSHCKLLLEEIVRVQIGMCCNRCTRVFVNPCKPCAHALLGFVICSCWKLFWAMFVLATVAKLKNCVRMYIASKRAAFYWHAFTSTLRTLKLFVGSE